MATPKILLVDDTKLFLKLEQEYLKQSSAQVFTAGNGHEALELARTIRPDLIYMDLNMPVMDGIEFLADFGDPLAGLHVKQNHRAAVPSLRMGIRSDGGWTALVQRCRHGTEQRLFNARRPSAGRTIAGNCGFRHRARCHRCLAV